MQISATARIYVPPAHATYCQPMSAAESCLRRRASYRVSGRRSQRRAFNRLPRVGRICALARLQFQSARARGVEAVSDERRILLSASRVVFRLPVQREAVSDTLRLAGGGRASKQRSYARRAGILMSASGGDSLGGDMLRRRSNERRRFGNYRARHGGAAASSYQSPLFRFKRCRVSISGVSFRQAGDAGRCADARK